MRLLALFAALLFVPAATSIGPATIEITVRQASFRFVDVGSRGPMASPGDIEIRRFKAYDRNGRPIGRSDLLCNTIVGVNRLCRGVYFFPRGNIVVGGPIVSNEKHYLAILGGTGLYSNARGEMSFTRDFRSRSVRVYFRLVG